jgi:hypothetical protein
VIVERPQRADVKQHRAVAATGQTQHGPVSRSACTEILGRQGVRVDENVAVV